MAGDDRTLKKTASNRKGVVGNNGRKIPINPSTTQTIAQTLNTILMIGLLDNILDYLS